MDTYFERFLKGSVDKDLIYKYRDSLLYERAAGRGEKPIKYLVLIASDALEAAHLLSRQEALNRKLPLRGPGGQSWFARLSRVVRYSISTRGTNIFPTTQSPEYSHNVIRRPTP